VSVNSKDTVARKDFFATTVEGEAAKKLRINVTGKV
jgi:hypothetical protein